MIVGPHRYTCYIFFLDTKPDGSEECLVRLKRVVDGTPDMTGLDLAYTINEYKLVEYMPETVDKAVRYAHGAGDLFAALIAMLKDPHKSDHVYLESCNAPRDKNIDFVYEVVVKKNKAFIRVSLKSMEISEPNTLKMNGRLTLLMEKIFKQEKLLFEGNARQVEEALKRGEFWK